MADIKKITLPDGSQYDIKDASALAKTAGASEAITGDLYMNSATESAVRFNNGSGTPFGHILSQTDSSWVQLGKTDSNGDVKSGLRISYGSGNNHAILFGDGGYIVFRPNGVGSGTGQVYITSDGQQIGGHPLLTDESLTADKSISASTTTNLVSKSGLTSSGVYLAIGTMSFTPSSSSNGYIQLGVAASATGLTGYRQELFSNSTGGKVLSVVYLGSGNSALYLNAYTGVAGKATAATLRVIRLS